MSTRASIQFSDGYNTYFVYRHCDGYPEEVVPDIEATLEKAKYRWSEPEGGLLTTLFLAMHYNPDDARLPDYEITSGIHGDEDYCYLVAWDSNNRKWILTYE